MNIINLREQNIDLHQILLIAQTGSVLIIAPDGNEYILAEAETETDDFEQEVEQLRTSIAFQRFLDSRSSSHQQRIPFEDAIHDMEAV